MDEKNIEKDSFGVMLKTARRALSYGFKKEPKLLSINLGLVVVVAIVGYLQITSFSKIVNEIIAIQRSGTGISNNLIIQSVILAFSFLIPAFFNNIQSTVLSKFRTRMNTHNVLTQIDSFSSLDIGTIEGTTFQTNLERASKWGVGSITNVIGYSSDLIKNVTGLIVSGLILISVSPYLVILAILGSLAYYIIENKYGVEIFRIHHIATDDDRIEGDRVSQFRDPKKIIEVILFNIKSLFRTQAHTLMVKYDEKLNNVSSRKSRATILADIIQTVCLMLAIVLVTLDTIHGKLLVGSLLLVFTVYRSFVVTSQNFFTTVSRLEEQNRFAKRWFDIFDIRAKIVSKEGALTPAWENPPIIEFKNVSFAYPETDVLVLKNISLTLKSGEKMAIVGENGAGKTSLIKLLCRVYDPTEGQVLIDGIDLREIDLQYWHEQLGILFQDFTNYKMTVREAIAIARPNKPIDDEQVLKAATAAEADKFIEALPKKYDHLLWKSFQDGVELSKGQFQRMAVARIFYRNALISVLDEPTSAIDAVAEEKIFEVLENKMQGKTVVLISHRFSTVKNADQIAVIEYGQLKELGNHKDLMAKKGRYSELYTMQASRYLETE